ncbi:hypothetical protein ABES35_02405 [Bacillus subtilis]|uniref:hypothetical protein n=1 Tax=Bacillus subtilis group TaxID=653685 RepID=UPI0021189FA7|nr:MULTISPECIES: hypothetical protein [Bacillus subtilis group]MDF4200434.1 hypothetical protein [Bacillus subtilis]MDF4218707.1 hypothetical protein [Bacillus subtilis]MEC2401587.1 hypothetical protein [Bacillus subtilis]MED4660251.1 hypothetical protein [Bacillus subtilis]MED4664556.1 hypothetical protein [Bacillus subtilis]
MITVLFRIGLYISSFFPLYILLVINNYKDIPSLKDLLQIMEFKDLNAGLFWIAISVLALISIISLIIIIRVEQHERHTFKEINQTEDHLLNYVVTYLLPLLSIEIHKTESLLVNAGLFALIGFLYVKNSLVYLNPLFLFFGYNLFKAENDVIIISNYNFYDLKQLQNERINCRKLSYNIYLIRK